MWPKDPRKLENIHPTVCEKHVFHFYPSSANNQTNGIDANSM